VEGAPSGQSLYGRPSIPLEIKGGRLCGMGLQANTDGYGVVVLDLDGSVVGEQWVDADMAKLVAEKLGVEPVFTVINWDNKVFELNGKGIDVVWNGMTITTAAQESMECTNAYCNNAQVVVAK
jgi:ABC-type amino acid transport substrate-binding protein